MAKPRQKESGRWEITLRHPSLPGGRKAFSFDTEAEAVRIANDTSYGLTNYVQSADGPRRNRLARQLRSGMVEMNGNSRGAGAPFGGVKASGRAREGGVWGIEEFLEVKAITGWDSESRS